MASTVWRRWLPVKRCEERSQTIWRAAIAARYLIAARSPMYRAQVWQVVEENRNVHRMISTYHLGGKRPYAMIGHHRSQKGSRSERSPETETAWRLPLSLNAYT